MVMHEVRNTMTPRDFIYWLNGFMDICEAVPTDEQYRIIKQHISYVVIRVVDEISMWVVEVRGYCKFAKGSTLGESVWRKWEDDVAVFVAAGAPTDFGVGHSYDNLR